MCELFEETFLYMLHAKGATNKEWEAEFSSLLVLAKSKHLEMGQNIRFLILIFSNSLPLFSLDENAEK